MGQFIPLAISVAGAAMQQQETDRVLRKQDETLAQGMLSQSRRQQEADSKVNEQIANVEASTADDARAQRLDQYRQALMRGRRQTESAFNSPVGGATFQADSANAARTVGDGAQTTAGLMARMDAPQLQRQGEAFGYGQLASDLGMIGRESAGDQFVNQLRLRQIRRRPEVDLLAGAMTSTGRAMGGMGSTPTDSFSPQFGANYYGSFDPMTMGRV